MDCGPFLFEPRAVRVHLDAGAVQAERLDLDADELVALELLEHPVEHAAPGPAAHSRADRVPVAEPLRQATPLAALLGHVEDRVEHLQVRHADVPALPGKQRGDPLELRLGDFHASDNPPLLWLKTT